MDSWPMLIAAGRLRRGQSIEQVARGTGLSVGEVYKIAERLARADERNPGRASAGR